MPVWGNDNLTQFLQAAHANQSANVTNFPEPYRIMTRINDCFSTAGSKLINPKPMMAGTLFLRCQYAYKTAVGMALAGQVVEAFVMMRSCLEYAGYALVMFSDPALEAVFLSRHFDDASMKAQKEKFKIAEVRNVIHSFDPKLAELYKGFYDRSIDFGGHPNPNAVLSAAKMETSDGETTFLTLALTADRKMLEHAMKCTAQVGLAALYIFQHIFKAKFELLGLRAEMDLLCQTGL